MSHQLSFGWDREGPESVNPLSLLARKINQELRHLSKGARGLSHTVQGLLLPLRAVHHMHDTHIGHVAGHNNRYFYSVGAETTTILRYTGYIESD